MSNIYQCDANKKLCTTERKPIILSITEWKSVDQSAQTKQSTEGVKLIKNTCFEKLHYSDFTTVLTHKSFSIFQGTLY